MKWKWIDADCTSVTTAEGTLTLKGLFIPLFIEQLLMNMTGTVNTLMLGHYADDAVAAVGAANQVIGFLYTFYAVFSGGASVVISQDVYKRQGMPRKKIDKLVEFAKGYGAKGLAYLAVNEDGTYKSSFAKFMTEDELKALVSAMQGEPGDLLLFAADKNKIVWNVLGALRLELAKELDLLDPNQYNFLWVTEFPLLEWSDEENRFMAMHHPFTMPMEEDWDKIDSDPGSVRAKAYDIVLNGTELGGGSVRIHQDDIQERCV